MGCSKYSEQYIREIMGEYSHVKDREFTEWKSHYQRGTLGVKNTLINTGVCHVIRFIRCPAHNPTYWGTGGTTANYWRDHQT